MNYKIVSDSSSNLYEIEGVEYTTVPLKIITQEREYVDEKGLDIDGMIDDLKTVKGKTSTACPSVGEWLDAFRGADNVFGISITSGLSGSYNAALVAKQTYEEENPNARVHIFVSLSTGAEMQLI
ncbi:MAG: DegV family protein, partial [Traorella sp.]